MTNNISHHVKLLSEKLLRDMSNTAKTALGKKRKRSASPPWPPIAPYSLDEARKRSRNGLGTFLTSFALGATFSPVVKEALDPQGQLTDGDIRQFLIRPSPQHGSGNSARETEYDALHFVVPPNPDSAPQGYDEIHPRNVLNHDILYAVAKQNAVEARLKKWGYKIDYAVVNAYLLMILNHLRISEDGSTSIGGKITSLTYDAYHDLRDEKGISTQYYHKPSQSHILDKLDNPIPEHALADCERLHEVYERPYFVRTVEDLSVIKAWESLTTDNCSK